MTETPADSTMRFTPESVASYRLEETKIRVTLDSAFRASTADWIAAAKHVDDRLRWVRGVTRGHGNGRDYMDFTFERGALTPEHLREFDQLVPARVTRECGATAIIDRGDQDTSPSISLALDFGRQGTAFNTWSPPLHITRRDGAAVADVKEATLLDGTLILVLADPELYTEGRDYPDLEAVIESIAATLRVRIVGDIYYDDPDRPEPAPVSNETPGLEERDGEEGEEDDLDDERPEDDNGTKADTSIHGPEVRVGTRVLDPIGSPGNVT